MTRLIFSLCCATALACTLGCSKKQDDTKTVTLWHIQTKDAMTRAVAQAVGRFESAFPDVSVTNTPVANDAFKQKIKVAIHRNPPDVFHTWGGGQLADFVHQGLVAPIQEGPWSEDFLPAAAKLCTVDGKLYAAPADVSGVVMWANTELFQKHNVTVPRTVDELIDACRTFRRAGVTPIALGARKKWPAAFYFIYLAVRHGGIEPVEAVQRLEPGALEHEAFVKAGRDIRRLVEAGAFPEGFQVIGADEANTRFYEGKAAMILMGNWLVGYADDRDKALSGSGGGEPILPRMKAFAFPGAGHPEYDTIVVGGVNAGYAVSAGAHEAAPMLVEHLTDRQAALDWIATGRIPARTDLEFDKLDIPRQTRTVIGMLEQAPHLQGYFDQVLPGELRQKHVDTTFDLFVGKLTPEAAAAAMEATAEKMRAAR